MVKIKYSNPFQREPEGVFLLVNEIENEKMNLINLHKIVVFAVEGGVSLPP